MTNPEKLRRSFPPKTSRSPICCLLASYNLRALFLAQLVTALDEQCNPPLTLAPAPSAPSSSSSKISPASLLDEGPSRDRNPDS